MAKQLVCGGTFDLPDGFYIEADLGNPVVGPPGLVSLYSNHTRVLTKFIGVYSVKFRISEFLQAIQQCIYKWESLQMGESLVVHLHGWTSGLGEWIINQVAQIVQPHGVTEYYMENPKLQIATTQLKLETKPVGHAGIAQYLAAYADQLASTAPYAVYLQDISIQINGSSGGAQIPVGVVCGLLSDQDCLDLGVIVHVYNDLLYIVSKLDEKQIQTVDQVWIETGEGALELPTEAFWNKELKSMGIHSVPYVMIAENTRPMQKYRPHRSYKV